MAGGGDFVAMELVGLKDVLARLDGLGENAGKAAREIVTRSAALVEAETKLNFSGAHPKGFGHVGGALPNVVTGTLRRSIRSDPIEILGPQDFRTQVAPREIYGRRVELGYNGSKGYPYFVPGATRAIPKLEALRNEILKTHLLR